jgi:hypothetical protein
LLRVRTNISGGFGGAKLHTAYFLPIADNATSAASCVLAMKTFWDAVASKISNAYSFQVQGNVAVVNPATGAQTDEIAVAGATSAGTNANDRLPPQIQVGIRLSSGLFVAGRRVTGRWNLPGFPESENNNDGTLSTAAQTQVANATAGLIGRSGADGPWVVWSRAHGVSPIVTSAAVRSYYYTLNSRRQ